MLNMTSERFTGIFHQAEQKNINKVVEQCILSIIYLIFFSKISARFMEWVTVSANAHHVSLI